MGTLTGCIIIYAEALRLPKREERYIIFYFESCASNNNAPVMAGHREIGDLGLAESTPTNTRPHDTLPTQQENLMNKAELIAKIAEHDYTQKEAARALNTILGVITEQLADGGDISLVGFGHFSVVDKPARQGRNPSNGEVITIPAKKKPTFKAGKELKDAVNK